MCWLCRLLDMAASGNPSNVPKYRPTPKAKECEICWTKVDTFCIFQSAMVCEPCFVKESARFPHVVVRGRKGVV